ncbi:MAG TPA: ATP-binding protein [Candidatus Eremiobacteraceae bacterium]|nr:ATP-binding protein [Candidatus Eremiobacteraceae bacterium]
MPADSNGEPEARQLSELLDVRLPADAEAIAKVVDTISENLMRLEVPEQKRFEVALAVQEALANAVVHGCSNDPSKQIRCRLKCDQRGRIVIIVTDPGPGFNPELLSDPRRRENLYADNGRGVYLIRQLMDEVHIERPGNEIRMWKY